VDTQKLDVAKRADLLVELRHIIIGSVLRLNDGGVVLDTLGGSL
jgi:hypothetical protein